LFFLFVCFSFLPAGGKLDSSYKMEAPSRSKKTLSLEWSLHSSGH